LLTANPDGGEWSGTGVIGNYFDPLKSDTGLINLFYAYQNGKCLTLDSTTIRVLSLPNEQLSYQNDTLFAEPGNENYNWFFNGELTKSGNDNFLETTGNGDYLCVVTSKNGCTDTTEVYALTSIAKDISDIAVFPNPATNVLFVIGIHSSDYKIFDALGKLVQVGELNDKIDISGLDSGIYILKIQNDKGNYSIRFVKE
jgi:hypothetical protein